VYSAAAAVVSAGLALLASAANRPQDYEPGDRFPTIAGFDPSVSPASIVIFVSASCAACQRSAEAFRQLTARPRSFQVIVVGYDSEDLLRHFVEVSAIEPDVVLSVPIGTIRFATVPRLALLDDSGIVRSMWAGAPAIASGAGEVVRSANALGNAGGS
jgi:hypothetical protein